MGGAADSERVGDSDTLPALGILFLLGFVPQSESCCWSCVLLGSPREACSFLGRDRKKGCRVNGGGGEKYGGVEEGQPVFRCTVSENNREMFYKNYDNMLIK